GKNSWLTGTAAWNWYTITQFILGIKPDYNGILVDPCVPKTVKSYKITRKFRGATYEITVSNPSGVQKGVKEVYVDDKKISGNIIPLAKNGEKIIVKVVMG
ncbi:MAG: glycosyl transferase, partial [Bacteroidales bacterium]|nr:glycosyl transferase [Bacteroidales bacterium]